MKLNLGCSDERKPGYIGVDKYPNPAVDEVVELNAKWPWMDSTVDEIYAHDVFEHLRGPCCDVAPKVWAMNESYRVLKPGGVLDMAVPCVYLADGTINPGAFADPTHVSFWTFDDRYYFGEQWNTPQGERGRLGPSYGIMGLFRGPWRLLEYGLGHERRSKIVARLEAVK
jgi:hypothetical protein